MEAIMERKIGLAPISCSGKEHILKLKYSRIVSNYGAEDRTCTYILFREGTYSKIEILPHYIKLWSGR